MFTSHHPGGRPRAAVLSLPGLTGAVLAATVLTGAGVGGARADAAVTGSRFSLAAVAAIPGGGAWAVGEQCPKAPEGCVPGHDVIVREHDSAWSQVPAPSPGSQAALAAVSADSASDAWAVGRYAGNEKDLYLHWTGGAWHQVTGPTSLDMVLTGVAALSPSDALAVGYTQRDGATVTVGLHWNGKTWSTVPTPDPGHAGDNQLLAAGAVPGGGAWAAGVSQTSGGRTQTLLLHWNGQAWSRASAPPVTTFGTALTGVAAGSGSDAWAVGQYNTGGSDKDRPLILHWNGKTWTRDSRLPALSSTVDTLSAVAVASGSSVWAAGLGPCLGGSANCPSKTLILHWNGTTWSVSHSVSIDDRTDQNALAGVAAASASSVWAVGSYFPAARQEPVYALLQHWNGSAWKTQ